MKLKGIVTWFNDSKGYGFIETPEVKQIFCHYSAIEEGTFKTLEEGQEVSFELIEGPKGPQAMNIVKIGKIVPLEGGEQ